MIRPRTVWPVFAACLAVMLAVTAFGHVQVLRLDRAQRQAQQQAQLEEAVRLALWRMDAAAMALIGQEGVQPYFVFSPYYPAERAYNKMFQEISPGDVLVRSPLAEGAPPHVLVHFQFDPAGRLSSPQVSDKTPPATQPAEDQYADRLAELGRRVTAQRLLARLPEPAGQSAGQELVQYWNPDNLPWAAQGQSARSINEYGARFNAGNTLQTQSLNWNADASPRRQGHVAVQEGPMQAVWVGDALLLVRRVTVNRRPYVQGCWLDWPAIRDQLLQTARELLPAADLAPVADGPASQPAVVGGPGHPGRMLATLPLRLIPGEAGPDPGPPALPLRMSLLAAWGCLVLAGLAVGVLLFGAMSLSQRRGDFVSAVTHELRTPLTTFRLYTEMLADDKVRDEQKRRHYLATLRNEAERLSHLVENVLAYAGLEAGRTVWPDQDASVAELLERVTPRLADRAEQVGMALVVRVEPSTADRRIRADLDAVEHVLFNLVDNACKHASAAPDRRIHLEAEQASGQVTLSVRDHGPGVPANLRRRLFRPFSKSARQAADTAPGVGLGLSLSRRLARRMGGRLHVHNCPEGGACFVLTLRAG